jgi:hypothetical protein
LAEATHNSSKYAGWIVEIADSLNGELEYNQRLIEQNNIPRLLEAIHSTGTNKPIMYQLNCVAILQDNCYDCGVISMQTCFFYAAFNIGIPSSQFFYDVMPDCNLF